MHHLIRLQESFVSQAGTEAVSSFSLPGVFVGVALNNGEGKDQLASL